MNLELVLDLTIPYIQDNNDRNSVSLVSKKFFDIDSKTRKHVTVHVHFAPDPKRLSHRFPNLHSLTLKSWSYGFNTAHRCSISVLPWILEITVNFNRLKSLSIRNMVVTPFDLQLLAKTRGGSLTSLEILGCKMFSEDGLVHIARDCIELRNLRLHWNTMHGGENANWLHELSLCNTVMESVYFHDAFYSFNMEDVTRLANKCSNSLVSLNVFPQNLSDFTQVFKHAKKLDDFGGGIINADVDYSGFKFPQNIRGLHIMELRKASYPFLCPYLNQLRKLDLQCGDLQPNCQCFFYQRCPNLEVLLTEDICGDKGFQLIGQFCKKLRKLTHYGPVTHLGLKAVAQGCPDLDYLEVHPFKISNEALECVATHLNNVRDLRIMLNITEGITDLPLDNGVRAMLIGCKKLERVDIDFRVGGLTDVGLGYIGKYGHNLRYLSLCNTGESDVGLSELLKGCPKLKKLRLSRCPFSEQALTTFVFNINHSIRYISVDGVSVLSRPLDLC